MLRALDPKYFTKATGQVLIQKEGEDFWRNIGSVNNFTLTPTVEKEEIFSNEYPTPTVVTTRVTTTSVSLSLEAGQLGNVMRAWSLMSDDGVKTQAAATAQTKTYATVNYKHKPIYNVGALKITNVSVKDASSAGTFVEGTHYVVHAASGDVQLLQKPSDAGDGVIITYDVPAITADDESGRFGILQNTAITAKFRFVGMSAAGVQEMATIHKVEITPSGDRAFMSGSENATITITGNCVPDTSQPEGYQIGVVETLN